MGTFFLDSSALVKRYIHEQGTAWLTQLTDAASGNFTYAARITGVEVASAVTSARECDLIRPGQMPIILPHLSEQRAIVVRLDALRVKLDALQRLQREVEAELASFT